MTQTRNSRQSCREALAQLDWYMDNELAAETNVDLAEHFEHCTACTQEVEARRTMRERLQTAVRDVQLPSGLENRVRDRLRESRRPQTGFRLMAIAAMVAVCFGSWIVYRLRTPQLSALPPDQYIAALASRVSPILKAGLRDHIHCAVIRQKITKPDNVDHLPEQYKMFLPAVRAKIPSEMKLAVAHECNYKGRKFIHLTFHNDRNLFSVIVARKEDGDLVGLDGSPFHQGEAAGFRIAAYESGNFLVYTISDLPRQRNLEILQAVAPGVNDLLRRLEA